mgnify:FL=1
MKKVISLAVVVLLMICSFAGCTRNPASIVIGVQNTRNCATSSEMDPALEKALNDALLENGTQVLVYEVDGACFRVSEDVVQTEYRTGLSKSNKQTKSTTYYSQIKKDYQAARPMTPEVDLMNAFTTLANALRSMSYGNDNASQTIYLVSNLLSTAGTINFAEASLYVDLNDYAKFVQPEMPDLQGIEVVWIVAGTADNQPKLNNSDIENLKKFYQTIITNAGGTVTFVDTATSDEVDKSTWPAVSEVEVRNPTYDGGSIDVTLEEAVLFKPNSIEWLDKNEAAKTLTPLVDVINKKNEGQVVVAGSTATTESSAESHRAFSLKRANVVKDMLVSLGADGEKIIPLGLGKTPHKYRVPDTGNFVGEENRAKNRCVFIVSCDSEKGQYFLDIASK